MVNSVRHAHKDESHRLIRLERRSGSQIGIKERWCWYERTLEIGDWRLEETVGVG